MGGPFNKAAYVFGTVALAVGSVAGAVILSLLKKTCAEA